MNEREIFIAALQLPSPAERAAYLDEACGGNADLRLGVEALLRAEPGLGDFLEPPPAPARPEPGTTFAAFQSEGPGSRIGPYKLLQQIGEGGMGVVYMAEQTEPVVRRVALKIIKPGIDTRQVIARFEAERQALALMDHPCIAAVFDAGATEGGRPYFVMELVKGVPITTYCNQQQLSVDGRLELFVRVCQAVQHAHQKGVIHRDLKPSNLLVALYDGAPVPKVIDFGLAKATSQRLTEKTLFTDFGQILGTIEYMSPEQAESNQLDIDTRSDIYSLGAVLYELLTGSTPLERARLRSAAFDEMLRIIREEEPKKPSTRLSALRRADLSAVSQQRSVDPRRLPSLFRGELDWVVMKALDKSRARRYETANGLARDIQRYLADETVEARPPSSAYRFRKFVARHLAGVAAAAAVALGLCAAVVGLAISNRLIALERDQKDRALVERLQALRESKFHEDEARKNAAAADRQRIVAQQNADRAEQQRDEKVRQLYAATMLIAHQEWQNRHVARVRELLDAYRPQNNQGLDLRGWEWHYLWRASHSELRELKTLQSQLTLAFTPDAKSLVTGGEDGVLRFWKADATTELRAIKAHDGRISKLAISAAGNLLATASDDGTVKVWETATGKRLRSFPGHQHGYYGMAMSSDGTRLAVASKEIVVFDVSTGSEIRRLQGHTTNIAQLAFSADGQRLASSFAGESVRLWNAATGEELQRFSPWGTTAVAIAPDGRTVITGHYGGAVQFWDADTGKNLAYVHVHEGHVSRIVVSSDGIRLATASEDTTVRIWNLPARKPTHVFAGHEVTTTDVAFAPQSDVVASCGWDASVRFWDGASKLGPLLLADPWACLGVRFSPNGKQIVVNDNSQVVVYSTITRGVVWRAKRSSSFNSAELMPLTVYDADGRAVAIPRNDGTVEIRNAQTGELVRSVRAHERPVTRVEFFPDGKMVTGSNDGEIAFWSADDAREIVRIRAHRSAVASLALSPDASIVASGAADVAGSHEADHTIQLWDGPTCKPLRTLSGHVGGIKGIVFGRDGKQLFSGSRDGTLRCWEVATGRLLRTQRAHGGTVTGLAMSPDGKRLASCSTDKTVKVWDAETGMETLTIRRDATKMYSIDFSPDGLMLATGGTADGLAIWDARPLTDEVRVELTALPLVESLFKEYLVRSDVLAAIEAMPSFSEPVRRRVVELAAQYRVTPQQHNDRSWAIVRRTDSTPEMHARALRAAEAACVAAPDRGELLNTLGVAQYRMGRSADAVATLTRSDELNSKSKSFGGSLPADIAFLAMAHYRLVRPEEARKHLDRLRKLCGQDRWKADVESQAFLLEAIDLISGPAGKPVK